MKKRKKRHSVSLFSTIKGKIACIGVFSLMAAVGIGGLGIRSLDRNSGNSRIESLVSELDVLQVKNLALKEATASLLRTASELKQLSKAVKEDLSYFTTEEG